MFLAKNALANSRNKALELIKSGAVRVNGEVATKPSATVGENDEVCATKEPFVSRAGEKLAAFLRANALKIEGLVVLDIGASKGGFTQIALQNGAKAVVCVDVGTNQLDSRLRGDPRVSVFENCDVREFAARFEAGFGARFEANLGAGFAASLGGDFGALDSRDSLDSRGGGGDSQDSRTDSAQDSHTVSPQKSAESFKDSPKNPPPQNPQKDSPQNPFDLVLCDVSFISLECILDCIFTLTKSQAILLFKPQFEVGRAAKRTKKGVVVEAAAIKSALKKTLSALESRGFRVLNCEESALKGKNGNVEFFIHIAR